MNYYYLKKENQLYGNQGKRISASLYDLLPIKHKELFTKNKPNKVDNIKSDQSGGFYTNQIINVNNFQINPDIHRDLIMGDAFREAFLNIQGQQQDVIDDDDEFYDDDDGGEDWSMNGDEDEEED